MFIGIILTCVVILFDADSMPKEAGLIVSNLMTRNRFSKLVYIGDEHLSGKIVVVPCQILNDPK